MMILRVSVGGDWPTRFSVRVGRGRGARFSVCVCVCVRVRRGRGAQLPCYGNNCCMFMIAVLLHCS